MLILEEDGLNIRNAIIESLDEIGIVIEDDEKDFDLQEYIVDSLQFISLVVTIEQKLNIEMPENLLLYERMKSFNGYCEAIREIVQSQRDVDIE